MENVIDIKSAIVNSLVCHSNLTDEILHIEGMSSKRVRHLLNNLCKQAANYLEIGCWKGSTLISAVYNNIDLNIYAIDNFSEFGAPREALKDNINLYIPNAKLQFFDDDFRNVTEIPESSIDVYFYDGAHDKDSQYDGIIKMLPYMKDKFILLVDDWNHLPTQQGTYDAITDGNLSILESYVLPADYNGDQSLYWNGLYVARISK